MNKKQQAHARSKAKKEKQLGMKLGTANSRMRKALLFQLAKKCNMHFCYQCGAEIEHIEEFSIEHKEPWLDSHNPIALYFDIDNIAFSHLFCNIGAARQPAKKYQNKREAMDAKNKRKREQRAKETPEAREKRRAKRREQYRKKKLEGN